MTNKNEKVSEFLADKDGLLKGIRSVLVFGTNTYSYKFALLEALLSLDPKSHYEYDEIWPKFLEIFLNRIKEQPKQGSRSDGLPAYCLKYLEKKVTYDDLQKKTRQDMKKYVFDAFQKVGGESLKDEYSLFDWKGVSQGLYVKDNLLEIIESPNLNEMIKSENQTRWQIVEEAWKEGIASCLIEYDEEHNKLFKVEKSKRVPLRSAINAFMPYQKGRCFYCKRKLNQFGKTIDPNYPEVDHVIPYARLRDLGESQANINGLWNLVLACRDCNRDKSDTIPHKDYIEKLASRNQYLIIEHAHSFKYGILISLGIDPKDTGLPDKLYNKMKRLYNLFDALGVWKPKSVILDE